MSQEPLVVTYQVTLDEYRAGVALWQKYGFRRRFARTPVVAFLLTTMFVISVIALGFEMIRGATTAAFHNLLRALAPLFVVWGVYMVLRLLMWPAKQRFFRRSRFGEAATLQIDDNGLRYELQDKSLKNEYAWGSIEKAVEDSRVVLLLPRGQQMLIVPKAQIPQVAAEFLISRLQQRNIPFKLVP